MGALSDHQNNVKMKIQSRSNLFFKIYPQRLHRKKNGVESMYIRVFKKYKNSSDQAYLLIYFVIRYKKSISVFKIKFG